MLNELPFPLVEIKANCYTPKGYTAQMNKHGLVDGTQFAMTLQLKLGARVMVISNIDIVDSLVNGSIGTVIAIKKVPNTGNHLLFVLLLEIPLRMMHIIQSVQISFAQEVKFLSSDVNYSTNFESKFAK